MKEFVERVVVLFLLHAALSCEAAGPSVLPQPDGEYAVGMRRFELTDPARSGVLSDDPREPRVLPGYVWYPAKGGSHNRRAYLTRREAAVQGPSMARNFDYGATELDQLDLVVAHSSEGATPARGPAFPILIFSMATNAIRRRTLRCSNGWPVTATSFSRSRIRTIPWTCSCRTARC